MSDLLSAEERAALREYGGPRGRRSVADAVFPSVSQLDPERIAALSAALKRWLDLVTRELSRQLRIPCAARPPRHETLAQNRPPLAEEALFWVRVEGYPGHPILLSLPRAFAAAICERIFGAPFDLRDDRWLAPAETTLLRDLVQTWLTFFAHVWQAHVLCLCVEEEPDASPWSGAHSVAYLPATDVPEAVGHSRSSNWIRFSSDLVCGTVKSTVSVTMLPSTARLLLGEIAVAGPNHLAPDRVLAHVGHVPLELRAILGRAELTVDELSSLRVGDVLRLDHRTEEPVEIILDEQLLCRAHLGLAGQRVALELLADPTEETS